MNPIADRGQWRTPTKWVAQMTLMQVETLPHLTPCALPPGSDAEGPSTALGSSRLPQAGVGARTA